MESETISALASMVGSGGLSFFAGWGLGKAIKLVIKIVAAIAGAFAMGVFYLQSQGFLTVNWLKIENSINSTVGTVDANTINHVVNSDNGFISNIASNLGVPMTTAIGFVFDMGFMRGIRSK